MYLCNFCHFCKFSARKSSRNDGDDYELTNLFMELKIGRRSTGGNQLRSRLVGDAPHRKTIKSWTLGDVKPARKISLDRLPEKR